MSDTEVLFHRLPFSYYAHGQDYTSNWLLWCVHSMDSCHSWVQSARMNPILMEVFNADKPKLYVQVIEDELAICSHFSVFDDSSFTVSLKPGHRQTAGNCVIEMQLSCYRPQIIAISAVIHRGPSELGRRLVKMCILLLISKLLSEAYLIKKNSWVLGKGIHGSEEIYQKFPM